MPFPTGQLWFCSLESEAYNIMYILCIEYLEIFVEKRLRKLAYVLSMAPSCSVTIFCKCTYFYNIFSLFNATDYLLENSKFDLWMYRIIVQNGVGSKFVCLRNRILKLADNKDLVWENKVDIYLNLTVIVLSFKYI